KPSPKAIQNVVTAWNVLPSVTLVRLPRFLAPEIILSTSAADLLWKLPLPAKFKTLRDSKFCKGIELITRSKTVTLAYGKTLPPTLQVLASPISQSLAGTHMTSECSPELCLQENRPRFVKSKNGSSGYRA